MNPNSVKERIYEALVHRPFECTVVHLYDFIEGKLVSGEVAAETLISQHCQSILSAISSKSGKSVAWRAGGSGQESPGLCFGACNIGPLVVVVGKPLTRDPLNSLVSDPVDSYFLDAVQVRVAEILGIEFTKLACGARTVEVRGRDDLSTDFKLLEVFESDWRRVYGEDKWLALKGGTVIAHGLSRPAVEQELRERGVKSPVLYVPPKKEERICEMFTIGL